MSRYFTTDSKVLKVGNSFAMIIPKIIVQNHELNKGDTMVIAFTDRGFFAIKRPVKNKNPIGDKV